jgi:hypothetical protein
LFSVTPKIKAMGIEHIRYLIYREGLVIKNRISLSIVILILLVSIPRMEATAQRVTEQCSQDTWCDNLVLFNLQSLTFPANLWRVEDILNVYMDNTSTSMDIYLVGTITEEYKGMIVKIKSGVFTLKPGITSYVNPAELEPIESELNAAYKKLVQDVILTTGSLPAGVYTICVCAKDPGGNCVGSGCVVQNIAHPSPPELIYPDNQGFVMEDLPVFSWLPPMPSMGEFSYTIEIVELLDGQIPTEAIESNWRWFQYDLDVTSLQYPISEREFIRGNSYAWRVGAYVGDKTQPDAIITSPVWSFTFLGSAESQFDRQHLFSKVSPKNNDIITGPPFLEWELGVLSSQKAGTQPPDKNIYFEVRVWQWPDGLDAGDAAAFAASLKDNPTVATVIPVNKLTPTFLNLAEAGSGIFKSNYTYFWMVTAIKDEMIIAESEVNQFTVISDKNFMAAAESMLNSVEIGEESRIYGVADPIPPGSHIESEGNDIDSIDVNRELFLFIIDDEPYSRYGHPVRYAMVDNETREVTVVESDWFPEVKHSEEADTWKTSGSANLKGEEIIVLTPRGEESTPPRPRLTADNIADAKLTIDCGNYVLLMDGGDKNRTGAVNNIASNAATDTDAIQALYEKKHYKVRRFSQYWDNKNEGVKALPVDPDTKAGAKFLKDVLLDIRDHYASMECCSGSALNFELVIYINANAIQSSGRFKLYKPDGSGVCEEIDYFGDILRYLQTLPQCVKITLFVDANYSGILVDALQLDSYLKRGNYEIRTATDALRTTPSGVGKPAMAASGTAKSASQQTVTTKTTSPKTDANATRGSEQSFTEMTLALEKLKELQAQQETNKVNLNENYTKVDESIKNNANEQNRPYPNPQIARINTRDEFSLKFPALKDQSQIRDCTVVPEKSANIIINKVNGQVTVFSKIEGEIKVIMVYENGSQEIKPITSRWGDKT